MRPEDFAQELELKEYEETQRRAIQPKRSSLSHCEDCGEAIPGERQAIGSVTRCIECQNFYEWLQWMGRKS